MGPARAHGQPGALAKPSLLAALERPRGCAGAGRCGARAVLGAWRPHGARGRCSWWFRAPPSGRLPSPRRLVTRVLASRCFPGQCRGRAGYVASELSDGIEGPESSLTRELFILRQGRLGRSRAGGERSLRAGAECEGLGGSEGLVRRQGRNREFSLGSCGLTTLTATGAANRELLFAVPRYWMPLLILPAPHVEDTIESPLYR